MAPDAHQPPLCVLLLPRELERFILRDQAEDLLRAPNVVAVDPPRLPYGAFGRMPAGVADALGARQARRLVRTLRRERGEPRVVVIYHPLQYPLARAMIAACPGSELWYARWDRYERAYDADAGRRARLEELHELAAQRSALTFAVSDELARLEREAGRDAVVVPPAADLFPAPIRAAPWSRCRSGISAGATTGSCCTASPSGSATGSCCCSSAPGTRRSAGTTRRSRPAGRIRRSYGWARCRTRRPRG